MRKRQFFFLLILTLLFTTFCTTSFAQKSNGNSSANAVLSVDKNKEPLVWAVMNNTPQPLSLPKTFNAIEDKEYSRHLFDKDGDILLALNNGKPVYVLDGNGKPTDFMVAQIGSIQGLRLREDLALLTADLAETENPHSINAYTKEQLDRVRYRAKDGSLDIGNIVLGANNILEAKREIRGCISYIKAEQARNK